MRAKFWVAAAKLLCSVGAFSACDCGGDEPSRPTPPPQAAREPAAVSTPAPAIPLSDVQRGGELYGRMCSVCHGPNGEGYKADHAPAIGRPAFLSSVTDKFLRRAISSGRLGTTMSAWSQQLGGPLSDPDLAAVIAYMRAWSPPPYAAMDERPANGDVVKGATLFAKHCQSCHGKQGMFGPDVRVGNPQVLIDASDGFLRAAVRSGRPDTTMRGFADVLGEHGVEDVIAYLRSLQNATPPAIAPARPPPPLPLGPVPLHPRGPEPRGFVAYPGVTPVDVVHAEFARGARMAFLDARTPSDYANEHIAGAVSVPFYDPAPYSAKLPKNAWLVCYCACPHAESKELAQQLMAAGFKKVTVLSEGLLDWSAKQYPTRSGDKP